MDINDDDISKLSDDEQEALFNTALAQCTPDAREAIEEIIRWIVLERPQDGEPITKDNLEKWGEEIIRRKEKQRRGTAATVILPFKKAF